MSEFEIRAPRSEELAAVGALTVAAYRADGLLEADPEYVHELADAARRAEHAELLVAVDSEGTLLGSVTVVRPGSPFAEISHEGELEFRTRGLPPVRQSLSARTRERVLNKTQSFRTRPARFLRCMVGV